MLQDFTLKIKDVPSPNMLNPVREKGRKARKRRVYLNQVLDLRKTNREAGFSELAETVNFPQGISEMHSAPALS